MTRLSVFIFFHFNFLKSKAATKSLFCFQVWFPDTFSQFVAFVDKGQLINNSNGVAQTQIKLYDPRDQDVRWGGRDKLCH